MFRAKNMGTLMCHAERLAEVFRAQDPSWINLAGAAGASMNRFRLLQFISWPQEKGQGFHLYRDRDEASRMTLSYAYCPLCQITGTSGRTERHCGLCPITRLSNVESCSSLLKDPTNEDIITYLYWLKQYCIAQHDLGREVL